jgi:hypothetical protein
VAGTLPVRPHTFSQLADHNLAGHIPMVSQFGRADHLTDHTGCQGNVVNQSDYGNQRKTGWRPNDRQYSPFTQSRPSGFVDHKRRFIKPSTFDGSTSWTDFKSHFEVCSELNGWSQNEKGMYLAVSLRGNAQGVLGNLPSYEQRDFLSLCKALEHGFAPGNQTELYRAQLRERKQKAVESLPELGQDIRRLTNLAYPTASTSLKAILAKEQFIDSLRDTYMRLRIKQARLLDLNDAIRHAVELQAFLSSDVKLQETKGFVRAVERNPPNIKSSETGQLLKNITEILVSLQSDLKALKDKQRNESRQENDKSFQRGQKKFKCYFCGKPGHTKNRCRYFLA